MEGFRVELILGSRGRLNPTQIPTSEEPHKPQTHTLDSTHWTLNVCMHACTTGMQAHAYTHTHVHACMHAYIHAYISTCTHTHRRTYMHTSIHSCAQTCASTFAYLLRCMQTYVNILNILNTILNAALSADDGGSQWQSEHIAGIWTADPEPSTLNSTAPPTPRNS